MPEDKEAWTTAYVQGQVDFFRNELDANFAVNGHVVDQYKRRLETVCSLITCVSLINTDLSRLPSTIQIAALEKREAGLKRNLEKIETMIARQRVRRLGLLGLNI